MTPDTTPNPPAPNRVGAEGRVPWNRNTTPMGRLAQRMEQREIERASWEQRQHHRQRRRSMGGRR